MTWPARDRERRETHPNGEEPRRDPESLTGGSEEHEAEERSSPRAAIVIVIITWLIGVAGFADIIAGAVEAFYVGLTGMRSFGALTVTFFIPTLVGNIIGGVTLVAALSHAQVASEGIDA